MQKRLSRYTITRWARDFMESMAAVKKIQQKLSVCRLDKPLRQRLVNEYDKSSKRLFLLDYDGSLVGFSDRPEKATPDKDLFNLLQTLAADSKNEIVIISGRDKTTLTRWLGNLSASLIAEAGAWIKKKT